MPASEVIAKAKAAGIKITDKYIYVIRANANRKRKAKPDTQSVAVSTQAVERAFRENVRKIGTVRAQHILAEMSAS